MSGRKCLSSRVSSGTPNLMSRDEQFMHQALALAAVADGRTHPNPMVGAVVVRQGKIVGEGYHREAGTPHAEVHALRAAGPRARGATLYVTLEPCCHQGRTPPCTEAIIASGIRRVVYAMRDPHPKVAGRGLRALRRANVRVDGPICRREAARLNRVFLHWITTKRPYVLVKVAISLDGKLADRDGRSQWITNAAVRQYTHQWRARVDAILIGRHTAVHDDPRLTVRLPRYRGPQPRPIIWVGDGPIPWRARLLQSTSRASWCVVSRPRPRDAEQLRRRGHDLLVARNVTSLLRLLAERDISCLMVEGGGRTIAQFIQANCVDYYVIGMAPKLLGGDAIDWVPKKGWRLTHAPQIQVEKLLRFGDNVVVEGPAHV